MPKRYRFTDAEGKILGPCDEEALRSFYETGYIDGATDVCAEDDDEWMPLFKAIDLTPKAEAGAPSPPAVPTPSPEEAMASVLTTWSRSGHPFGDLGVSEPGLTLRNLLRELADRAVALVQGNSTPQAVTIENVGRDVVTLALSDVDILLHVPLARLRSIRECAKSGEVQLLLDA